MFKQQYESTGELGDCLAEPVLIEALKNQKVVNISAGCRHAACTTDAGKLHTWGFNFYEQLGLGDSEKDFDQPTRVTKNLVQHKVRAVSCGYFHTAALVSLSQ
jgi:alpha-tubulin suppressor-like RCC1 family protein